MARETRMLEDAKKAKDYGLRPDGTRKGSGWLGELRLPDGKVATEYSVGVNIGGREMDIPSLVPTLTKDELNAMVTNVIPNNAKVPEAILLKAVAHAKERLAKGESVWAPGPSTDAVRSVRQAAKAGDAGRSPSSDVPKGHNAALDGYSGPKVVINPSVFKDEKDGLCVAFDEAFRILMEVNGFDPVAEPTEKQRRFFADTAYANDERMLRRTILARICTFDTSVTDPTDEQLEEAVEFLDTVMEIGAPQNEWEQSAVQRIRDTIAKSVGQPRAGGTSEPPAPEDGTENSAAGGGDSRLVRAAEGAGTANDEEEKRKAQASETASPATEPTAQESGEPAARPPGRDDMNQAPHPTQDYNKEGMAERGVGYVTDSSGQVIGVNGLTDPNKGVATDSEIQRGISIIPVKTASPGWRKPDVFEIANRSDLEGDALSAAMKKTGAYTTVAGTWMDKTGKPIGGEASANQYLKALDLLKGTGAYYDHGGFRTGGKVQGLRIGNDLKSVIDYVENYGKKDGRYYDGGGVWRTKDRVVSRFAGQPAAREPEETRPVQPPTDSAGSTKPTAQPVANRQLTKGEAEWQERYNAARGGSQTVAFQKNASETAWQETYEQARRNTQDRRAVVASGKRIKARRIDGTVEYDDGTVGVI